MTIIPPNAQCLACGYSLEHLENARCPECGRDFNPNDASSFRVPRTTRPSVASVLSRMVCSQSPALRPVQLEPLLVWAVVLGAGFFWVSTTVWLRDSCFWLAPPLVVAWCARLGVRRLKLAGRPDPYRHSERIATGAYLACCLYVATVMSYNDWSCDHGWGRGIGPVGIANSKVGGPCRNHVGDLVAWHVTGDWYVWCGTQF